MLLARDHADQFICLFICDELIENTTHSEGVKPSLGRCTEAFLFLAKPYRNIEQC